MCKLVTGLLINKCKLFSGRDRPFASFDNIDLYPNPAEKAAAVLESILINHPFIDGNKRTAFVIMRLVLLDNGLDIVANQDEKYKMVIVSS